MRSPDLRRFLAAEAECRAALESQAHTVATLKVFFRFLVENEHPGSATRRSCHARRRSAYAPVLAKSHLLHRA